MSAERRQRGTRDGGDDSPRVLEIHDAGLAVVTGAEAPGTLAAPPSPGFALLDEGPGGVSTLRSSSLRSPTLRTGEAARKRARLDPRQVHHRFWQELDADVPLPRPFPREWSPAELAHAHLQEVRERLEGQRPSGDRGLILAVPGSFDPGQLGLLLGIAGSLELPVTGLVDSAVAACRWALEAGPGTDPDAGASGTLVHLDLHLHRAVLTEVARRGGRLRRRRVEMVEEAGQLALEDLWAREVAAAFLRATRFDPLHSARTEQALYLRLPAWLEEIETRGGAELTLASGGGERSVEVSREALVAPAEGLYRHLHAALDGLAGAGSPATLLLSHHAASLPGLAEGLGSRGRRPWRLAPGAAGHGALAARGEILASPADGGVRLVLELLDPLARPRAEHPRPHAAGADDGPA